MEDTIVAIATTVGQASISVIRVSGEKSLAIVNNIFKGKNLLEASSHTINYGHIVDENNNIIDEVMVSIMLAPKSYTRENVVEISCHGSFILPKKILSLVIKNGARLAEAGEFTKRAFLNGRIDLSQAEAVMDLINSKSEIVSKNSLNILSGRLKEDICSMRANILEEVAYIEACLDDPEHYQMENYGKNILQKLELIKNKIKEFIDISKNGAFIKNGIKVAIVGLPNAGKSSLLNALSNKDRAIVTNIEGTTRDTIEEEIILDDVLLNIIDTAGIRDAENEVERIGIEKSKKAIEEAELILYVIDSSMRITEQNNKLLDLIGYKECILILNKIDKISDPSIGEFKNRFNMVVKLSLISDTNLMELTNVIKDYVYSGKIVINDDMYIANERQRLLLIEAGEALDRAIVSIIDGYAEDFISIDLTECYRALGKIVGEEIEEDIINKIFKDFCMGK